MNDIRHLLQEANKHLQNNNIRESKRIYQQINRINPGIESTYALALIYGQEGDYKNAEKLFKNALRFNKSSDVIWNNLGIAQKHLGKLSESVKSLKKSLNINPKNSNAKNALGNIYQSLGDSTQAEKLYLEACKLNPDDHITLNNLASIYIEKCDYNNATPLLNKAMVVNHNYFSTHYNLGSILQSQGNYKVAISYYKNAATLDITSSKPNSAIASCYELMGDYGRAMKYITPLIDITPVQTDIALIYGKLCSRLGAEEEGIKLIKSCLMNKHLAATDTRELHFTLADLYDKKMNYNSAFKNYKSANNSGNTKYNITVDKKYFQSIKYFFSTDESIKPPVSNNPSHKPVFIIGMPRSGTSLVEQILASHSDIYGAGELTYISDISNKISNRKKNKYPYYLKNIDENTLNIYAQEYLKAIDTNSEEFKYCTDKMPHNFIYVGLIKKLFKNCKIIHCSRNPLDTCLSIYFHNFNTNHPYASDLNNLGHYYNLYKDLMSFWETSYSSDIYNIQYESLLDSPEENIKSLLNYLNLEWQDECLHFYKNKRTVNTPSYNQVRKPMYKTSTNRWKNYQNFITPLINAINK